MTRAAGRVLLWVVVACLSAGCITVEDFGKYWDKDPLDRALAGRWVSVVPGKRGPNEVTFVRRGRNYGWIPKGDDDALLRDIDAIRTLQAGDAKFLLMKGREPGPGLMMPYRITGDRLEFLNLPDDVQGEDLPRPPPGGDDRGYGSAKIGVLDDAALEWLATLHRLSTEPTVFVRRR